eukprot:COSAG06_NODE_3314_length_5520_cov_6.952038_3_plen_122_part_00
MNEPWHLACMRITPDYGAETALFEPFIYKKSTFYQDRLGTNTGKTQKKCRFPSDEAAEFEGDVVHDIEHALNTYALDTHTHTHTSPILSTLSIWRESLSPLSPLERVAAAIQRESRCRGND